MERHPPILERLTSQIAVLLERYTQQQREIERIEQEKSALVQALEEKEMENRHLYNEIATKEKELEGLFEQIRTTIGGSSEGGGSTTANFS